MLAIIFTPVSLALSLVLACSRQYMFMELMNARATHEESDKLWCIYMYIPMMEYYLAIKINYLYT